MTNKPDLNLDHRGDVILNPVIGWITGTAADIGVLLAVQYAELPDQLQTGGKQIQFVLTPQQALELAAKLTTLANRLLIPTGSDPVN